MNYPATTEEVKLYKFSADNTFDEITEAVSKLSNNEVQILGKNSSSNSITSAIKTLALDPVSYIDPIGPFFVGSLELYDESNIYDNSYSTSAIIKRATGYAGWDSGYDHPCYFDAGFGGISRDVIMQNYADKYYYCFDMRPKYYSAIVSIAEFRITKIKWYGLDVFENESFIAETTYTKTVGFNADDDINESSFVVPIEYYTNKTFDTYEGYTHDSVQIPQDVVDAIRSGAVTYLRPVLSGTVFGGANGDGDAQDDGWYVDGACIVCSSDIEYQSEKLFVDIEGELQSGYQNTFSKALDIITVKYGAYNSSLITGDFANLAIGKTITDAISIGNEADKLCSSAMVATYITPDNDVYASNWVSNIELQHTFDSSNIIRDSITEWRMSPIDNAYNEFTVKHNFNYGSGEYDNTITITNVDQASFPLEADEWYTWVSGIGRGSTAYTAAKTAWERCRIGYEATGGVRKMPDMECSYFRAIGGVSDETCSAWKVADQLTQWLPIPRRECTFSVSRNYPDALELLQYCSFSDYIYTGGVPMYGWVTKISRGNSATEITLSMAPVYDTGDRIIETGLADTNIIETGSQTDNIVEGA